VIDPKQSSSKLKSNSYQIATAYFFIIILFVRRDANDLGKISGGKIFAGKENWACFNNDLKKCFLFGYFH